VSEPVVWVENLGKRYRIRPRQRYATLRDNLAQAPARLFAQLRGRNHSESVIWALKGVSFTVDRGEVLGIVGRNGAGKTTLLRLLSRITRPTEGEAEVRGRVGSLLEVGTGFHPELSGRENVYLSGAVLGMKRREINAKFDEIVAFSGVEQFLETPLKRYSIGMQTRLAFAVAAHLEPEILLVDEVLAVGDLEFQRKCLGKMGEVARGGRTVLLVSHQMNQVRRLCQRAIWLDGGRMRAEGLAKEVVNQYEADCLNYEAAELDRTQGTVVPTRWYLDHNQSNVLDLDFAPPEVVVKIYAYVKRPIRKGTLYLALKDVRGAILWSELYHDFEAEEGMIVIAQSFSELPLHPGVYTWDIRILDGHNWDVHALVPELSITSNYDTHVYDHVKGFLRLKTSMQIQEPSDEEATEGAEQ
jgi:homopolymeric O-antigen transport system ATP-binding protein